jgi:signal peptidase I
MTSTETQKPEPEIASARLSGAARGGNWKRTLLPLGLVLAASLLVRSTLFESFSVPTEAMSPALLPGDIVLVNKQKPIAGRLPKYGGVIVYVDRTEGERLLVRRVVGLPGDRIRIRDGRILRNGKFVSAEWKKPAAKGQLRCAHEAVGAPRGHAAPPKKFRICKDSPELPDQATLIVPKSAVFVLGDRRAIPQEIAEGWLSGNRLLLPLGAGLVHRSEMIGTVTRIVLSITPPGTAPGLGWTERIRWDRFWKRIEIP